MIFDDIFNNDNDNNLVIISLCVYKDIIYMSIKYAEITIIRNLQEESMLNYLNRLVLKNENKTNDNDTIITLFDDGTVIDNKDEYVGKKITMGRTRRCDSKVPLYFHANSDETFFSKSPVERDGVKYIDFKKMFSNNHRFLTSEKEPSVYNSIYHRLVDNRDVLAIVRIKSSEQKPRYLLAYDDEYLEKCDVVYLANYVFSQSNEI
jgi:hypothetical protein